jgi:hypothetical protein
MADDTLLYGMPFKYWKVGFFGNQKDIENIVKRLSNIIFKNNVVIKIINQTMRLKIRNR